MALAFIDFILICRTPAPWEESTKNNILYFSHNAPIEYKFCIEPVTLDACVITISFVLDVILLSISFILMNPLESASTISISIPMESLNEKIGRITELCSIDDVITWSPDERTPFIRMFSEVVTLFVKITLLGESNPKKLQIISRVLYKYLLLSSELL